MSVLTLSSKGLYCPAGDFHIDPWRPVKRAVITHAHADHARPGSKHYLGSAEGEEVLRLRVHPGASLQVVPFGEAVSIGDARVSLHPAGHILGSAQVRVETKDGVWVVSGDYKTERDVTCTEFEPVSCDTFITECTFGLPIYHWKPQQEEYDAINRFWLENQSEGRTTVVFAYALGKAQRILAALDPSIGPIVCHGTVRRFLSAYKSFGAPIPQIHPGTVEEAKAVKGKGIIIAPASTLGSGWLKKYRPLSTAFASGWMSVRGSRRRRGVDRGFVISDHVDWPGLLAAVEATGASRVLATHGASESFVRFLRDERGIQAESLETEFGKAEEAESEDGDSSEER